MATVRRTARTPSAAPAPGAARGFTLIEVIVAVAIVTLIGAAVATIFGTVGDTIDSGKRVSQRNTAAASIEAVLRRDIERLTRDGFLVIRQELTQDDTGNPRDVRLSREDASDPDGNDILGRPRRIDELLFFARGQFESRRTPLDPSLRVTAAEAMVYYGHGQRWSEAVVGVSARGPYFLPRAAYPEPREAMNFAELLELGAPGGLGIENPNRYAGGWTVLRHATLLVGDRRSSDPLPVTLPGLDLLDGGDSVAEALTDADYQSLRNSRHQHLLQPAMPAVFTTLTRFSYAENDTFDAANLRRNLHGLQGETGGVIDGVPFLGPAHPASGLVEIATTDIGTLRSQATGIREIGSTDIEDLGVYRRIDAGEDDDEANGLLASPPYGRFWYRGDEDPGSTADRRAARRRMAYWMADALPSLYGDDGDGLADERSIQRMRYEPVPPWSLIPDYAATEYVPQDAIRQAMRAMSGSNEIRDSAIPQAVFDANQEMLAGAVFLAGCTEFIVEWSRGARNDDGGFDGGLEWYGLELGRTDANDPDIRPALIRSEDSDLATQTQPDFANASLGSPDNITAATWTFGWDTDERPWPELIRITIRLADPGDPTVETTLQYVFEVPG